MLAFARQHISSPRSGERWVSHRAHSKLRSSVDRPFGRGKAGAHALTAKRGLRGPSPSGQAGIITESHIVTSVNRRGTAGDKERHQLRNVFCAKWSGYWDAADHIHYLLT